MTTLVIRGGDLITPLERRFTDLAIHDGLIEKVGPGLAKADSAYETIDATNCFVTPGLFDLQVNGGPECNLWNDPSIDNLQKLSLNQAHAGVTSFLPTLITDDIPHLKKNIRFLEECGIGEKQVKNEPPERRKKKA